MIDRRPGARRYLNNTVNEGSPKPGASIEGGETHPIHFRFPPARERHATLSLRILAALYCIRISAYDMHATH